MRGFLLSRRHAERHAELLARLSTPEGSGGDPVQAIVPPEGEGSGPLGPETLASIKGAFHARDHAHPEDSRRILGIVTRAPNLEWLHLGSAGVDNPIFQELMDRGVLITNSSGVTAEPIAQSVLAGLLMLNRGFPKWMAEQRRHEWVRDDFYLPRDLRGQTIVVLGLGSIGGYVARYARAIGMHVVGVRRRPAGPEDGIDEWTPPDRLDEVLPRTDALAITVPLSPETEGMIDARRLALMPRGALLINVARGKIVVEPALIEALQSGQVGGAYLDVFTTEPLEDGSPLWDMPNVIISPHDAGRSTGNAERIAQIFEQELENWAVGRPSRRVVER